MISHYVFLLNGYIRFCIYLEFTYNDSSFFLNFSDVYGIKLNIM